MININIKSIPFSVDVNFIIWDVYRLQSHPRLKKRGWTPSQHVTDDKTVTCPLQP